MNTIETLIEKRNQAHKEAVSLFVEELVKAAQKDRLTYFSIRWDDGVNCRIGETPVRALSLEHVMDTLHDKVYHACQSFEGVWRTGGWLWHSEEST
jgi:hypothetical protein